MQRSTHVRIYAHTRIQYAHTNRVDMNRVDMNMVGMAQRRAARTGHILEHLVNQAKILVHLQDVTLCE